MSLLQYHRSPTFRNAVLLHFPRLQEALPTLLPRTDQPLEFGTLRNGQRLTYGLCRHFHPFQLDWMEERKSRCEGTNTRTATQFPWGGTGHQYGGASSLGTPPEEPS